MKKAIVVILSALVLVVSLLSDMPVSAGASYEGFTYDRSGNESAAHDVTAITVAKPGDIVEGDLLIGVVITDGDTSGEFTGPTGWTLINEGWSGASTQFPGCTLGAWYRVAGGSEPGSYQWTWTTAETVYAFIIRITGHNTDNPIDVWDFSTGTDNMLPTCPDVTTTVADTLVLRIFSYDSCYGWNATYPDEYTGITVESSRPGCVAGAQGHCSGGAAYATQATAGATGTADFQVTDGQSYWAWRTLTITVNSANEAPVATPQSGLSVNSCDTLTVTLSGTDPDNDPLTYIISTLPTHGNLYDGTGTGGTHITSIPYTVTDATHKVTYQPNVSYSGADSFGFKVNDGTVDSTEATISITVSDSRSTWYRDSDNDTYGDPNVSTLACSQPTGYVSDNTDCDDTDASVNPGATEVPYNGKDDDCNPATLDDDLDGDTYGIATDCDDTDASVNPGATALPPTVTTPMPASTPGLRKWPTTARTMTATRPRRMTT